MTFCLTLEVENISQVKNITKAVNIINCNAHGLLKSYHSTGGDVYIQRNYSKMSEFLNVIVDLMYNFFFLFLPFPTLKLTSVLNKCTYFKITATKRLRVLCICAKGCTFHNCLDMHKLGCFNSSNLIQFDFSQLFHSGETNGCCKMLFVQINFKLV